MWPYFCMPFLLACTSLPSELKRKLMMGLRLSMARMRALSALAASAISHSTATSTGAFAVRLNWICCRHRQAHMKPSTTAHGGLSGLCHSTQALGLRLS